MRRQHRLPCRTCPFRRAALRGFLGGTHVDEFQDMAQSEARMPCHERFQDPIDYAAAQQPGTLEYQSPQCAGRAVHFANQQRKARDPRLLVLPADHATVFISAQEFRNHHDIAPRLEAARRETGGECD